MKMRKREAGKFFGHRTAKGEEMGSREPSFLFHHLRDRLGRGIGGCVPGSPQRFGEDSALRAVTRSHRFMPSSSFALEESLALTDDFATGFSGLASPPRFRPRHLAWLTLVARGTCGQ